MNIISYEIVKIIILLFIIFLLIGFCILDGFDIGVCILIPFIGKDDIDKRILINSIAPHWDGNQVWLVTLIGLIFSAWPLVYSTIFNSLYSLINITIISLILRPISLDFRSKISNNRWKYFWDIIISLSSLFIIFTIGSIIGIIIQGINFNFDKYINLNIYSNYNINLFTILIGLLFVINSLVQGSVYLQIKTIDYLYNISNKISNVFILFQFLITILVIFFLLTNINGYANINLRSVCINSLNSKLIIKSIGLYKNNYINNPILMIFPICNIIQPLFTIILNIYKLNILSLISSSLTIFLFILTLSITLYPFIVPSSYNPNHSLTIWNSTSSEQTLKIIILFIIIFIPIITLYTIFAYKKMSGKISRMFIEKNKEILY